MTALEIRLVDQHMISLILGPRLDLHVGVTRGDHILVGITGEGNDVTSQDRASASRSQRDDRGPTA